MLNLVFQDPQIRDFRRENASEGDLVKAATSSINEIFSRVVAFVKEHHPKDYLGNFCKNTEKCKILVEALLQPPPDPPPAPTPSPSRPPPPTPFENHDSQNDSRQRQLL